MPIRNKFETKKQERWLYTHRRMGMDRLLRGNWHLVMLYSSYKLWPSCMPAHHLTRFDCCRLVEHLFKCHQKKKIDHMCAHCGVECDSQQAMTAHLDSCPFKVSHGCMGQTNGIGSYSLIIYWGFKRLKFVPSDAGVWKTSLSELASLQVQLSWKTSA